MDHRCYGCMQLHDGDFCPHCGWPKGKNNEPHQLPVGTLLRGQYEVGRVLGQGGFGITYLGWDRHLDSAVCIKEYFPNHAVSRDCAVSTQVHCHTAAGAEVYRASKERFLREGKILAQFRDIPEIVSIYGFFEENDTVYIVMEYIKGMDLARYIRHRGGRLSPEETFRILKPVMEALAQVHRAELVHRDIAPDNIMLHPRGGAKLLDFGAARMVENADVDKGLDRSTEAIVKHGFAPMEQYQTRGNLGPWTDVYAMCATVYYCLTGQIPPEATTRMMGEAEFSWANVPGLTDRQRYALERGMAILPRERYSSMEELLDGLFGEAPMPMAYTEPVRTASYQPPAYQAPAYQAPQPPVADRKKRSGKGSLIALVSILVVAALGVGGFLIANMLSGALRGSKEPALKAPVATEAPAVETPATEAPAIIESFTFRCIAQNSVLEDLPEQLMERLAEKGADFTMETNYASSIEEITYLVEMSVATGNVDALILQLADPTDEQLMPLLELLSAVEIPTILVGYDPAYDLGDDSSLEDLPNVCYVGVDPRVLADHLTGILRYSDIEPDKNNNASLSYAFLGGMDAPWETHVIDWRIPYSLEEWGYSYSQLGKYTNMNYREEAANYLTDTLLSYYDQVEVVFCTDTETVMGAVMACEMVGMDFKDIAIVGIGDSPEVAECFENGYLTGYVDYSRDAMVDLLAEVLLDAVSGGEIGGRYIVPYKVYTTP